MIETAKQKVILLQLAFCALVIWNASTRLLAQSQPASTVVQAQETGSNPATTKQSEAPTQPPPGKDEATVRQSERVTLQPGMVISVRIADKVDSSHEHTGDLVTGMVDPSLIADNRVLIPRGTEAHVRVVEDKKGGHLHGKAVVQLELISLVMDGRRLEVESDAYMKKKGAVAAKVEGAAPSGAGAATDMALGADPGAAASPVIAVFRAAKVQLAPGTRIEFTLTAPFSFDKPATDKAAATSQ